MKKQQTLDELRKSLSEKQRQYDALQMEILDREFKVAKPKLEKKYVRKYFQLESGQHVKVFVSVSELIDSTTVKGVETRVGPNILSIQDNTRFSIYSLKNEVSARVVVDAIAAKQKQDLEKMFGL